MEYSLSPAVQNGLAWYYVFCALINVGFGVYHVQKRNRILALTWFAVAGLFLFHAVMYWPMRTGAVISPIVTQWIDQATNPVSYFVISTVAFAALLIWPKQLTEPNLAWGLTNLTMLLSGWAMTNPDFRSIITKADNVPIVILLVTVGYFTWLGLYRAVINDELIARGEPPMEKDDDKVLVWPDLVYTELIAMVICTAVLVIWAIYLKAPLEQPATTAKAPNPSKAPWYFLGLQEMLVYFDPWMAGVVLPTFIITGLIAMPYIDFNPKGNGYYTLKERTFAMWVWLYGFLVLWVVLIVLGTILRGPNWNFFGPFEPWDAHKVVPLNNVNLSDLFWIDLLGQSPPGFWLVREMPGIILTLGYFLVIPPLLAKTVMRTFFIKMGFLRYITLLIHLLFMASLPIKMVLRWVFNLKYIVYIPEYFFNI